MEKNKINVPYDIEKNIPISQLERNRSYLYPFEKMQVGDSFKVFLILNEKPTVKYKHISSAINYFKKTHKEIKFTLRTLKSQECIRCWRIK